MAKGNISRRSDKKRTSKSKVDKTVQELKQEYKHKEKQQEEEEEDLFDASSTRIHDLYKDEVILILSYLKLTRGMIRKWKQNMSRRHLLRMIFGYHHNDPNREIFCLYRHYEIERGLTTSFLDAVTHVAFSVSLRTNELKSDHWKFLQNNRTLASMIVMNEKKTSMDLGNRIISFAQITSLYLMKLTYEDVAVIIGNVERLQSLRNLSILSVQTISGPHDTIINFSPLKESSLVRLQLENWSGGYSPVEFLSVFEIPTLVTLLIKNFTCILPTDEIQEFYSTRSFSTSLREIKILRTHYSLTWLYQLPESLTWKLLLEVPVEKITWSYFVTKAELFYDKSYAANRSLTYLDVTEQLNISFSPTSETRFENSLTHLNLSNLLDYIQPDQLESFFVEVGKSNNLRYLNVDSRTSVATESLLSKLKSLDTYSANNVRFVEFTHLKTALELTNLTCLSLEQCSINKQRIVRAIAHIPNLKRLSLSQNPLRELVTELVSTATSITWLNVSACQIPDAAFAVFATNKSILSLNVSRNITGVTAAKALLKDNKTLTNLTITNTLDFPQDFEALLFENTNLRNLTLPTKCKISHKPRTLNTSLIVRYS